MKENATRRKSRHEKMEENAPNIGAIIKASSGPANERMDELKKETEREREGKGLFIL